MRLAVVRSLRTAVVHRGAVPFSSGTDASASGQYIIPSTKADAEARAGDEKQLATLQRQVRSRFAKGEFGEEGEGTARRPALSEVAAATTRIARATLGDDHPVVGSCLNDEAVVLKATGEYAQAVDAYMAAFKRARSRRRTPVVRHHAAQLWACAQGPGRRQQAEQQPEAVDEAGAGAGAGRAPRPVDSASYYWIAPPSSSRQRWTSAPQGRRGSGAGGGVGASASGGGRQHAWRWA